MKGGLTALGVLLGFFLVVVASPAYAQNGLTETLSPTCVTVPPGGTATVHIEITFPPGSGNQTLTVATIGSIPKSSNFTFTSSGKSNANFTGTGPFSINATIRVADGTVALGNYQMGVVARTPTAYGVELLALHVVQSGSTGTGCSPIGLPLPESTFLVTATSLGLGLLTQAVTRRFVNLDAERRMKAELNAFNKEKREATASNDKAKLEKLKKRELSMRQAQSKVQLARTKVTFITIVPLFAVYYLMASFLGGYGAIVAVSPLPIPYLVGANGEMVLIWWYFIGSFTLSSILGRLLRTTT
jgi:uncharacterized membrane protein (DUF106 family)